MSHFCISKSPLVGIRYLPWRYSKSYKSSFELYINGNSKKILNKVKYDVLKVFFLCLSFTSFSE